MARASRYWRSPKKAPLAKKRAELQWGSEIKVDGRMGGRIGKGSDPPTDRRPRCKGAYTRRWVAGITTPQGLRWKAAWPRRRSLGRRTETAQTDHQSSTPTHAGTGELEGKQAHVRRFRLVRQSQATRLRLLYHEYTSRPTWQRS